MNVGNQSRIKAFLTAALLPILLIVSFIGSEGTLLCFGKDGHVAIEFVDACSGEGLGSELGETESDACGPCTDVQFQSSTALLNHRSDRLTLHDQPLTFQSAAAVPSSNFIRETETRVSIPFQKSLVNLSSVVLRI